MKTLSDNFQINKLHFHHQSFIFILYILYFFNINISKGENSISKITLTINGTGNQKILDDCSLITHVVNYPDDIYVNNISQRNKNITFVYNLTEEINNITILWNRTITDCTLMFLDLSNLTYIDLSYFDTSLVTTMDFMFCRCSSLISVNVNNLNTSLVSNMECMFQYCTSLISLNLNNFDTSLVTMMGSMFSECSSLTSLNINNFNTSLVFYMGSMFSGCSSLTSSNLNNFDTSSVTNMLYMFSGCSSLKSLNLNNFDTSSVDNMVYMFSGCSSLTSLNLNNFDTSKVTKMSYMFYNCSSLVSLNLNNFNKKSNPSAGNMFSLCNSNLTICINEAKADNIYSLLSDYKIECNNICFTNINDTEYRYEYKNKCYKNCPYGTHNSSINEYLCEKDNNIIFELFNNSSIIYNDSITKKEMENNIREEIMSSNLDELINELINNEKEYLIIEINGIKYEITTTNIYNENKNKNISIIKLGECENLLRNNNNISENEPLIIFKIDIYEKGLLIPIVGYDVYDIKNKKQLDLNVCKNTKIELLLPCIIDESEQFKYNISSDYYNDICYPYITDDDSDIILSDRRNEYFDKNMSLCENNCEYGGYSTKIKKSICKCEIKTNSSILFLINKEDILNTLTNINYKMNLKINTCFKELFTLEGLKTNFANYIIFSIIIINLICLIIFIKKDRAFLMKRIEQITIGNNIEMNLKNYLTKKFKKKKKKKVNKKKGKKEVKKNPPKHEKGRNKFNNKKKHNKNINKNHLQK